MEGELSSWSRTTWGWPFLVPCWGWGWAWCETSMSLRLSLPHSLKCTTIHTSPQICESVMSESTCLDLISSYSGVGWVVSGYSFCCTEGDMFLLCLSGLIHSYYSKTKTVASMLVSGPGASRTRWGWLM